MSHGYYGKQWLEAQMLLGDILQQEVPPDQAKPEPDKIAAFQLLATMYVKYVQIFRRMEQCYDQIVHPQKRRVLRHLLDGVMGRVLEIKNEMVLLELNEYHYFDDVLSDLKLTPSDVEMPIPKYFTHERAKALKEREKLLGQIFAKLGGSAKEEFKADVKLTTEEAIRIIQVHERARQGRLRAKFMREIRQQEEREKLAAQRGAPTLDPEVAAIRIQKVWKGAHQRNKTKHQRDEEMMFIGMAPLPEEDPKTSQQALAIKGEAERRKIQEVNEQEYQQALITIKDKIRETEGPDMKESLQDQIRQWFIECRDAIGKFPDFPSEEEGGSLVIFKEKDPAEVERELEEAEAKKGAKKDKKGKKDKKDKKDKKKDDKKKKGKKKDVDSLVPVWSKPKPRDGGEAEEDVGWKMGLSNFIPAIHEGTSTYTSVWAPRDESENFSQKHDSELIKEEKRLEVESEIRLQVDELMRQELKNLKLAIDRDKGKKGKKGKSGKKGKGGKGKKGKKGKDLTPDRTNHFGGGTNFKANKSGGKSEDYLDGPHSTEDQETWMGRKGSGRSRGSSAATGFLGQHSMFKNKKKEKDLTGNRTIESLYEELVSEGIIARPPKVQLSDYAGEYSYLGTTLRQANIEPMPSLSDVRRLIVEYAILPLGSPGVHEKAPLIKSLMFAGPLGTGKKMLVHAICTEIGANLFDLTATNLTGKYPGKDGLKLLLHMVFKVGRALQPSIIFVGDCEKMFKKKVPKTDLSDPKRLKKELPKTLKTIKPEDRLLLIGTTCAPFEGEMKTMCNTYQKIILIPRPDYASRHLIWRKIITKYGGILTDELDISSLAKISDGYTAGMMETVCITVLNEHRVKQLHKKPLKAVEFISPLAKLDPVYKEEEETYKTWFAKTPLGKKRAKALAGEVDDPKGGKKGGKNDKGKKKK